MSMRPCPFCGGTDIRWGAEKSQGHRFKCMKCHALGPWSEPDRGATARETSDIRTDAAAKLWNTRLPDDEASKIIREAAALISSPDFKNECDRLREQLAKCYGDRMVVDQRVKELEAALGVQEGMPR